MKSWFRFRLGSGLWVIVSVLVSYFFSSIKPLHDAALGSALVSFAIYWQLNRKLQQSVEKHHLDSVNQVYLQTISHLRHDWMNDLQLLFGYVRLQKYEKLNGFMETIKDKMNRENTLTKLGEPELAIFLLSYRTRRSHMQLHIDFDDGVQLPKSAVDREAVTRCVREIILRFEQEAEQKDGGVTELYIDFNMEPGDLQIEFAYEAAVKDDRKLLADMSALQQQLKLPVGWSMDAETTNTGTKVTVTIPFQHE